MVKKTSAATKSTRAAPSSAENGVSGNGSLLQQLIPYWEKHQGDESKGDLQRSVNEILAVIDEYVVLAGMESVSFLKKSGDVFSLCDGEIAKCLIYFLDCAVGAVIDLGKVENAGAATSLLELTVAVAAAKESVMVCEAVLARLSQFSVCDLEFVRVMATTALGSLAKNILELPTKQDGSFSELVDALQQAIVPRFTDKAVSVRAAAVQAAGLSALISDPDILQAVLWVLQHDPSSSNRCIAATTLPVSLQTIDYLVHRLRDVKATVRTTVLAVLRSASISTSIDDSEPLLEARHIADIITAGYTDRCLVTKQATRRLICMTWIKAVRYNPVQLLRCINVINNPAAAAAAVQALQEADPTMLTEELSEAEIRAFHQGLSDTTDFSIDNLLKADVNDNESALQVERLFLARTIIGQSLSASKKDALLSKLVPDITVLCQVLERFANKLIQALATNDDNALDQEEEDIFICSELLQLATIDAVSMEEGSRRVFTSVMKSMLVNILTPDDLVEGCVKALQQSAANNIDQEVTFIVSKLDETATDELQVNFTLRTLSIIAIILETVSPSPATIEDFARHIVPAVTHPNALVREAAISCFGRLGLFTDPQTVKTDYKPTMLNVATDDNETMEIRAQAMLALTDWSMLFIGSEIDANFRELIEELMEPRYSTGTICVAAEIAAKLLVTGKVCDSNWLARLVLIFFGETLESDDKDVTEVGSPLRLQQLLSVFFPAFAVATKTGRDAFMGSILPLLELVHNFTQQSKKKSRKALPVTKMLDFVISSVEMGRATAAQHQQANPEAQADNDLESSPRLLAAVQVATFLSEKGSDLSTSYLRALCKLIGEIDLIIDNELWEHLSLLKELLEELGNVIDDNISLRSFAKVTDLLVEVEIEDEVEDDNSDQESLADAMDNITITHGDENEDSAGRNVGSKVDVNGRDSIAASVDSMRHSRRLRPSN